MADTRNTITGERRELARMAKIANQAMRRLERADETGSPAYRKAQAYLKTLGVKPTQNGARRFPETYNSMSEAEFLAYEKGIRALREPDTLTGINTGTVSGYRKFKKQIYDSADKRYGLRDLGITQDEYLTIWDTLPERITHERVFDSDVYITIIKAMWDKRRNKKPDEELPTQEMSVEEIINAVQSVRRQSDALELVGITSYQYYKLKGTNK